MEYTAIRIPTYFDEPIRTIIENLPNDSITNFEVDAAIAELMRPQWAAVEVDVTLFIGARLYPLAMDKDIHPTGVNHTRQFKLIGHIYRQKGLGDVASSWQLAPEFTLIHLTPIH